MEQEPQRTKELRISRCPGIVGANHVCRGASLIGTDRCAHAGTVRVAVANPVARKIREERVTKTSLAPNQADPRSLGSSASRENPRCLNCSTV